MRVCHAILIRPRSPTLGFPLRPDWQRGILMPDHQPIRLRRFVKQGRSKCNSALPQGPLCDADQSGILSYFCDSRVFENMAHTRSTPAQLRVCQPPRQLCNILVAQHVGNYSKPLLFNPLLCHLFATISHISGLLSRPRLAVVIVSLPCIVLLICPFVRCLDN